MFNGELLFPSDLAKAKTNLTASTAPTVNDDASAGYSNGSLWYDTTTLQFYVLVDNTEGAAVWVDLTNADDSYQGAWAASTNTPTLADGTGTNGDYYLASDAGTVDFGSGNITFTAGDQVIYNGTIWQKIEGGVSYVPVNKAGDTMTGTLNAPDITVDNIDINGNSISITDTDGNLTLIPNGTGHVDINEPPSSEASGIDINGTTYDSAFRINDIGGSAPAQAIIHKHSTTLPPALIGARTNSDTDSHADVTAGQSTLSLYGAGWTGSHYDICGQIDISMDTTGTISSTSSPGRIRLMTTPDGSNTPEAALTLDKDKKATFAGDVDINDLSFSDGTIRTTSGSGTDLSLLSDTNADISLTAGGTGSINLTPSSSGNTTVFDTPATYDNGVNIGISTYSKMFRVIHSGGSEKAQAMLIRHSTAEAPTLIGGRANSDTDTPATIANDQESLVLQGMGFSGTGHYDIMAQMKMKTASSGTISSSSMPGEIVFSTTQDGAQAVTDALTIDDSQNVTIHAGDLNLSSGDITVSNLTADELMATDSAKKIVSLPVSTYPSKAEIAYVKGVTSAIQTQLDAKSALDTTNTFTKTQSVTPATLTSSSNSVAIDASLSNNFVHTLTENTTFASPSNLVDGTAYNFIIKQDASTARTLAFNSTFLFEDGVDPTISTTLGSVMMLSCFYTTVGGLVCVSAQNFS